MLFRRILTDVGIRSLLLLLRRGERIQALPSFCIWKRGKLFTCRFIFSFAPFSNGSDWFGLYICACVCLCSWCHPKHRHRFCFVCKPSHSIKINFAKYLLATNLKRERGLWRMPQSQNLNSRDSEEIIQTNWMRFHVCVFPVFLLLFSSLALPCFACGVRATCKPITLYSVVPCTGGGGGNGVWGKISRIFAYVVNFLFHLQIIKWINKTIIRLRNQYNMWIYRL